MPRNKPAVFLDRDGTINEQMGYINHISRFQMLPGAAEAIARLNRLEIPVVVVSNQSGLARGYFPEELLVAVHEQMNRLLADKGAHIDGLYWCPHHPDAKIEQFKKKNCGCRKPGTGLLEQAARELNLDLKSSFMVGDRWSDLKCGKRAGATSILVLTGYGRGDLQYIGPDQELQPSHVAKDLSAAVDWISNQLNKD
jgi:D-glycero-D-manno-heptose 1,7-bisphosphate phosphatase